MKSTLVIARRELLEKRFVFIAAIAFAVLTVILPFAPGVRPSQRSNVVVVASMFLSIGFTLGLAAILGGSIVGRELSEGRLSFYFAKPVPAASIWFGKLIGATLLVVVTFGIIAAPALSVGTHNIIRVFETNARDALTTIRFVLTTAAVLFLVTHVIGTFVRSRSPWIAFDFIAAAIFGWAIWMMTRPLLDGAALRLTARLEKILAIYLGLVILAAGAWQLSRGRTDRRRSHIELSRFLWSAFGCGLLVTALFVGWVVSATPADLIADFGEQASNGSWAIIQGNTRNRGDYRASFLYNIESGQHVKIATLRSWSRGKTFSHDGRTAMWLGRATDETLEVYVARLDLPKPQPSATGITLTSGRAELSAGGSRVVVVDRTGILTVYDIAGRRSLGSLRLPGSDVWRINFPSPDTLLLYAREKPRGDLRDVNNPLRIFEYSLATKKLRQTGELATTYPLGHNGDFSRMLTASRASIQIHDARTGALLTALPTRTSAYFVDARFLQDGRIAAAEKDGQRATLRLFAADGAPLRDIALPGFTDAIVHAEIAGSRVILLTRDPRQNRWSLTIVDANSGSVLRTEPGLQPAFSGLVTGPELLCMTTSKDLVAWNPVTGAKRVIAAHL